MEKVKLTELISLLEKELIRQHYKEGTLTYYRTNWSNLIKYFNSRGEEYFSEAVAMEYVDKKCDFFSKEQAGLLTQSNIYLFRMVRMIGDFQQHGTVLRRYMRSLSRINNPEHKQLLDSFNLYCKSRDYSKSTCKSYRRTSENFLSFLEAKDRAVKAITTTCLTDFVKTLMGYSSKMVEFTLCGIRAFLRFLYSTEILQEDMSEHLPSVKTHKKTQIPSVWTNDELSKLTNAIDRGNPSGKRDYAMILLAARLGLRCIDIKNLTFSAMKWGESRIEIVQSKSKEPLSLPLLKDVGWAIIDYLKNGRPESDSPVLFLRHIAPVAPFSDEDHLHQIIVKYMRMAKLPISGKRKVGMHSLRHTLATTLLEHHMPIQEIADILGHRDVESTTVYLKSSLTLLSECSLNPDAL